ncbi:MAG: hypothetical protein RLZZ436_1090 [Planctomycetota bacterium]
MRSRHLTLPAVSAPLIPGFPVLRLLRRNHRGTISTNPSTCSAREETAMPRRFHPRPARSPLGRPLLIALAVLSVAAVEAGAADDVRYSTSVAPLLRTYCSACHNRTEASGGFSVLSPDELLKGSEDGPVISTDQPDSSRLLAVIASTGEDHMPPADQPQPTPAEVEILRQWVRGGATFDSRVALLPALPAVKPRAPRPALPTSLDISPDGTRQLLGKFRAVDILAFSTAPSDTPAAPQLLNSLPIPDGKVTDVHFSRDGSRILAAAGTPGLAGRAVIAAAADATVLAEFSGASDILYSAAWSPDESLVATAGYDRIIRLYHADSGKLVREITGHNGAIFDLAFSPDGSLLASASADATVKIWQTDSGVRLDTLSQPLSEQASLAFHPDGNSLYAVGADSRIRQWRIISRSKPEINPLLISRFAHEGAVSLLRISADGQLLATASDTGSVKLWHAASVTELAAHSFPGDAAVCLEFVPQGRLLVITRAGARHLLSLPDISRAAMAASGSSGGPGNSGADAVAAEAPASPAAVAEAEPNGAVAAAQQVPFPTEITGVLHDAAGTQPDTDLFRFPARRGQPVLVEVFASRNKSPVDSRVEILTQDGQPVLHVNLQAVRDSWFTFRGKDSDTSDDFRLFNWQEMELNEYLYADGEVVRLWLYPRGPDSGFKVYPGFGQRQTWFNTTPVTHPLQGPAFIVVPKAPGEPLTDTGLPVFPVYCQNDDDPLRQWGSDSRLAFNPPADGDYLVRIEDARGFQGADFSYQLRIRRPAPDFSVAASTTEIKVHPGTGREIVFTATRLDNYSGPIEITARNLPPGFAFSDPVIIQAEQRQAFAALIAAPDAVAPSPEAVAAIRFVARGESESGGQPIEHEIGGLKTLEVLQNPGIRVVIRTDEQRAAGSSEHTAELTVTPGTTIKAWLKVERIDHKGLVEFGKEDSGRNLPHGVFVDNIGLNGLMLLDGQTEREVFITTAPWVPEQSRPFYLKSSVGGGITTLPVMLHVRAGNLNAASR